MTAFNLGTEITGSTIGGLLGWDGSQWQPNVLIALSGTGSPNSVVTAGVGAIYINLSGGAGTTLYVKESGSGNVGWVGK